MKGVINILTRDKGMPAERRKSFLEKLCRNAQRMDEETRDMFNVFLMSHATCDEKQLYGKYIRQAA